MFNIFKSYGINVVHNFQEQQLKRKRKQEFKEYLLNLNFDFNPQDLYDYRDRCVALDVEQDIDDYIHIDKNGYITALFSTLVASAIEKHLGTLVIPEGIEILLVDNFKYKYLGNIIFPSSIKGITTAKYSNVDNAISWSFSHSIVSMQFSNSSKAPYFGVLDLSKCRNLTEIKGLGFSDINAKTVIFPDSLSKLDSRAFMYSNIENLYFQAENLHLEENVFEKSNIGNLYYNKLQYIDKYAFSDSPNISNLSTITLCSDATIDKYALGAYNTTLYLPLLSNVTLSGFRAYISIVEKLFSKSYKEFTDKEWDDVYKVLSYYLNNYSSDIDNETPYWFHSQRGHVYIEAGEMASILNKRGILLGLGTLFYFSSVETTKEGFVNVLIKYVSCLWDTYTIEKPTEFKCLIYDADIEDNPQNRNYIILGSEKDDVLHLTVWLEESLVEKFKDRVENTQG